VASLQQQQRKLDPDPSSFKGHDRPVEQVSWDDAVEFCDRLTAHTGKPYRLPSEAEWEYACRAGTTTPFHFGDTIDAAIANYDGRETYGKGKKGEYRQQTTPVGSFPANAWGLFDCHGNVWEWCQDDWHANYQKAPSDGTAWLSTDESGHKILRGGSWIDVPVHCRSADRDHITRDNRYNACGFRVVGLGLGGFPRALR
jgi:formylglycine-generating enzyme required for sulfatase activity